MSFLIFTVIGGGASIYGLYSSLHTTSAEVAVKNSEENVKQYFAEIISDFRVSIKIVIPYSPKYFPLSAKKLDKQFNQSKHIDSPNYNFFYLVSEDSQLYENLKLDLLKYFEFGVSVYKNSSTLPECINANKNVCKPDFSFSFRNSKGARAIQFSTIIQNSYKYIQLSIYELPISNFLKGKKIRTLSEFKGARLFITYPTGMTINPIEQPFLDSWKIVDMHFHVSEGQTLQVIGHKMIEALSFHRPVPKNTWVGLRIDYKFLNKLSSYKMKLEQYTLPNSELNFNLLLNNYHNPEW